jgi:AcrR family transcriptional regulator
MSPRPVGRPARLSLDAILDAAVELGITTFTTAGLARRLHVSEGALYRHVGGTAQIVALACSRLLATLDTAAPDAPDWPAYLEVVCARLRALALRHPGFGGYVLAGEYDEQALAVFDAILHEVRAREPGLDRDTAYLLGSQAFACTIGFVGSGFVGAVPGEPTERDLDEQFGWMIRSLLRGMAAQLAEGVTPPRSRALGAGPETSAM